MIRGGSRAAATSKMEHFVNLEFQEFDIEFEYKSVVSNIAGILSRKPFHDTPKKMKLNINAINNNW